MWAPPLVEMAGGIAGHLLAWERHERDGSWWAWVSWVHESSGRHDRKMVQVRTGSLRRRHLHVSRPTRLAAHTPTIIPVASRTGGPVQPAISRIVGIA